MHSSRSSTVENVVDFVGSPELGLELNGIVGPKYKFLALMYVMVHIRKISIYGRMFPSATQVVGLCLLQN